MDVTHDRPFFWWFTQNITRAAQSLCHERSKAVNAQDKQREYFLKQARLASQTGLRYYHHHDYSRAIAEFKKAVDYYNLVATDSVEYYTGLASILYNLGSAYLAQRLYPLSAIFWLEECLAIKKDKLKQIGASLSRINDKLKMAQQLFDEKKRIKSNALGFNITRGHASPTTTDYYEIQNEKN